MFETTESVFEYGIKEAEEDGYIFDVTQLNQEWKQGIFNYVTIHLLRRGYLNMDKGINHELNEKVNISNILDLLNQANQIVKTKSNNFKDFDHFFSGEIELPNGDNQKVFIQQNETGKFTIMLPEDY